MTIRALIFWIKDFFAGKTIRSHSKYVTDTIFGNLDINKQKSDLKKLLEHATTTVKFYSHINSTELTDFPIIDKSIIKENLNDFISFKYDKEDLFKEMTSGSTGTPLIVYQDGNKRKHAAADTIAFSDFAGYKLGSKLYYSRVWNKFNRKSKLQSIIQNIIMYDSDKLTDDDLQHFIATLESDHSQKSVLIFASTLTALYLYMKKNNIITTAKVNVFITMSESLPINVRIGIQELFNCPVVSRYSNCECGILAQQCNNSDEYHINSASFYIELLKFDSDIPAEEGVPGRIIVTDLFNYSMPIIRYDTGDVGVIKSSSKYKNLKVFSRIDGRKIDCIYSTSGKMLSPYVINNTMWRFLEIKQYQFIQNDKKDYTLKINCDQNSLNSEKNIIKALKEYIGENAKIEIIYVDEIPLLSSGKRKQVINNYNI